MEYKWVAVTVTMVGSLMAGIDDRMLIIGLPSVTRELGAGLAEAIWMVQAYSLASTLALLLMGRVADMRGRVKIYNIGFVIFTAGSAFAALSLTPSQLIISRLIQGVGAAALNANSLAIVTDASPPAERGLFISINQIGFRTGALLGLTISGVILSLTTWRALFYVNIPLGIFGTLWARKRLKEISVKDPVRQFDWPGFFTFTTGLTLVLVAMTLVSNGLSGVDVSVALFGAGGALLVAFVIIERRSVRPLLDLALFKIRLFAFSSMILLFSAVTWNGMIYMSSFFLQIALGLTPLRTGLTYLPLDGTLFVVGVTSGRLADRYGSRVLATTGLAVISTACFLASTFTPSTPYIYLTLTLVLLGVGQGMFNAPNRRAIMNSVPPMRRGVAAGFSNTLSKIGDVSGPGVALTILTLGIPATAFAALLAGSGSSVAAVARDQFVTGYRISTLALGAINCIAIIPSLMRGPQPKPEGRNQSMPE